MAKQNAQLLQETEAAVLELIKKMADTSTNPAGVLAIAEAYKAVAEAAQSEGRSGKVY